VSVAAITQALSHVTLPEVAMNDRHLNARESGRHSTSIRLCVASIFGGEHWFVKTLLQERLIVICRE